MASQRAELYHLLVCNSVELPTFTSLIGLMV